MLLLNFCFRPPGNGLFLGCALYLLIAVKFLYINVLAHLNVYIISFCSHSDMHIVVFISTIEYFNRLQKTCWLVLCFYPKITCKIFPNVIYQNVESSQNKTFISTNNNKHGKNARVYATHSSILWEIMRQRQSEPNLLTTERMLFILLLVFCENK